MAVEIFFGPFRLDLSAGELFKGGTRLRIQQHPLSLLELLIDREGTLVSREEIRGRLWPNGTVVDFEHSINSAINKLRGALSDTAENPVYVETVARKGYRFLAPVRRSGEPTPSSAATFGTLAGGAEISHYCVEGLIGSGGMGLVYRARDVYLERSVALKILPDATDDARSLERFHNEARTLSGLDHPNICTVYEFGEHLGRPFMAMQLLDGETVKDRIARRGPFEMGELVSAGVDIANGLDAAHRQGIVHQDIKPSNIFLTRQGPAKVLDFGIATGTLHRDPTGSVRGTPGYMSPEQIRGGAVDPRTDIFSLGLVLYEMATGRYAFAPTPLNAASSSILKEEPVRPSQFNPALSPEIEQAILKALEKEPRNRFASVADLRGVMEQISDSTPRTPTTEPSTPVAAGRFARAWAAVAAIVAMAVIGGGVHLWRNDKNRTWAQASIPRVQQLAAKGKHAEGYDLAVQVLGFLPAEPTVSRLMSELSDDLTVTTTPPGAEVYLRRLGSAKAERLGLTPIQHAAVARGEFIVSIRKAGYADFERTLSSSLERLNQANRKPWEIRIEHPLRASADIPPRMARVPGGDFRLMSWTRLTEARATLGDFNIDRFEVSNGDFKEFVSAGGYEKRQFWGKDNVQAVLKDKTGFPGPREWVGGTFPEGKQSYPVTGITWPEASAYCHFRGKDLPSLHQWEKAARGSLETPFGVIFPWGLLDARHFAERANFESAGPTPVDSFEFGMSPFGVYNMAGNVSEWIRNPYDDGFTVTGGAWNEPAYQFGAYSARPTLHSADTLGFRCAMAVDRADAEAAEIHFSSATPRVQYPAVGNSQFETAKLRYAYKKTPLNSSVVGAKDSDSWRREEVSFDGFGGERVTAFLYLPKNAKPPFQLINFLGGGASFYGVPVTRVIEGGAPRIAPYVRAGRAVLLVVLKGFAGREPVGAYGSLELDSRQHREILLSWTVDMQRAIDYIETRPDIDSKKIAFMNHSTFTVGAVFAGVDPRYASVIVIGAGAYPELLRLVPEVNPLQFVPHIRAPKLLLNGQYDDGTPISMSDTLFGLMKGPKHRSIFAGGHIPPPEIAVPLISAFLDETLGPVHK